MLVSEVKDEMRRRGITISLLASLSHYSAGFLGQVLNRTKEAANLPVRVRHALEEIGILSKTTLPPTDRQIDYLKKLGFTGQVTSRDEASAQIQRLLETLPPDDHQLALLNNLGFTGQVSTHSEARGWIHHLKQQKRFEDESRAMIDLFGW